MGPRGPFYPYLYHCDYIGLLGTGFMQVMYLGRAPRTKETLPDFLKWRRVTRHPLVFRGLTGSQRTPGNGASHVAHPGIIGKASVFSATSKNRTWIIDIGASDHMTWDSNELKYVFFSSQSVISTANGSTSPITGEGSVILSNALTLDTVLVIPSLEYNLLSVSQIT